MRASNEASKWFIRCKVADLDLEAGPRPHHLAGRVDDGLAHRSLVEHRQLHSDFWQADAWRVQGDVWQPPRLIDVLRPPPRGQDPHLEVYKFHDVQEAVRRYEQAQRHGQGDSSPQKKHVELIS